MSAHTPASIAAHALRSCALLSDVLVTERADRPPGRNLAAWVCPAPGAPAAAGVLHAQLVLALGERQVPATIVCVDTLAAPLPAPDAPTLGVRAFEQPHGALEQALAAIWQDLLGIEHVGRNAHFFELGGHSSLAVRMVYRVQQSLQVSVAMRELFHQPQLHQFAAIVAERRDAAVAARAGTHSLPA